MIFRNQNKPLYALMIQWSTYTRHYLKMHCILFIYLIYCSLEIEYIFSEALWNCITSVLLSPYCHSMTDSRLILAGLDNIYPRIRIQHPSPCLRYSVEIPKPFFSPASYCFYSHLLVSELEDGLHQSRLNGKAHSQHFSLNQSNLQFSVTLNKLFLCPGPISPSSRLLYLSLSLSPVFWEQ